MQTANYIAATISSGDSSRQNLANIVVEINGLLLELAKLGVDADKTRENSETNTYELRSTQIWSRHLLKLSLLGHCPSRLVPLSSKCKQNFRFLVQ